MSTISKLVREQNVLPDSVIMLIPSLIGLHRNRYSDDGTNLAMLSLYLTQVATSYGQMAADDLMEVIENGARYGWDKVFSDI